MEDPALRTASREEERYWNEMEASPSPSFACSGGGRDAGERRSCDVDAARVQNEGEWRRRRIAEEASGIAMNMVVVLGCDGLTSRCDIEVWRLDP